MKGERERVRDALAGGAFATAAASLLPVAAAVCLIEFQVKCNDSTPPSMKDQDSTRCHDEQEKEMRERSEGGPNLRWGTASWAGEEEKKK